MNALSVRVHIQKLIVDHWVGIVFAFLIGLSVLAPQLIWRSDARYQGIDLMGQDAEEHYIARVNEVYKGDLQLGNTFLPNKDTPYVQPPLGEIMQVAVGKIFFLDTIGAILFSKFLFPFLIALVVYAFTFILSRSRIAALIGTASAILGHLYMSGIGPWLNLIHGILPIGSYTLFARPINPEISSLLMFIALFIFYRAFFLKDKQEWWEVGSVGLLTGFSLYMNPYTFTFLGCVLALLCVWFFIQGEQERARQAFFTGSIALLTLIPFISNYLVLHASPDFTGLAQRQGLIISHHPLLSIWLVIMLGATLFAWPKVYTVSRAFFVTMILALWILTDQNLLTGIVLFPEHYHWYITKPLLGVMLGMYAAFILRFVFKNKYLQIGFAALAVLVLFYTSPLLHLAWYKNNPDPPVVAAQAYAPVLGVLNTISGVQTVWADQGLSTYISIYTKHNTPNNPYAIYYLNSQSFYENLVFLDYRFKGETPKTILAAFTKDKVAVSERIFGLYYRQSVGDLGSIPDAKLVELAEKYRTFYTRPYADIFAELHLTVVVAPLDTKATYDKIPNLHLLQSISSYNVYTVTP